MTTPRIANAIGQLDEDLICSAIFEKAAEKRNLRKTVSVAAGIAVVLAAALTVGSVIHRQDGLSASITVPPSVTTGPSEETQLEKYYDYTIDNGTFSLYVGGHIVAEERIGGKLEDVTVTAGWKNEAGQWISAEKLQAEVYAISDVQSNMVAALRFIDRGEAVTTEHYYIIMHPNAAYNGTSFPDYLSENPVRYMDQTNTGKANGWQDLGTAGEIRTITVPVGSSYVYQMYSYYIRNDLRHMYPGEEMPAKLEELPLWLTDTVTAGRRTFWYSMGLRIPERIRLTATDTVTSENGAMTFIKAEYLIRIKDGAAEKEENWVIYFMEENGIYSACAVVAHENFDFVKTYTESIIRSYQKKP